MKNIKIEFVSDITFVPVIKGVKKRIRLPADVKAWDLAQQIQRLSMPAEAEQADVLIVHCSRDFYLAHASQDQTGPLFLDVLEAYLARGNTPWVLINTIESSEDGFVGVSLMQTLSRQFRLSARLAELALAYPRLRLVDTAQVLSRLGYARALSVKSDFVMKLPYRLEAIEALAGAYTQAIEALFLPRKKVLAVDGDNTLWGGILGEDGPSGLKIDPVHYPGAAYWRFQQQLKAARDSGLVLALVSKNNDSDMVDLFERVRMPLSLDDFAIRRVNWQPKSENIVSISQSLNVGIDSIVLIDDNLFELEQVRSAIPEVEVYRFPSEAPEESLELLYSAPGLKTWRVTAEDDSKTRMYQQEAQRLEAKTRASTLEEYLRSLELRLEFGVNRVSEVARISQLTNKTNQFNLTTRRYGELDIERWMREHLVYDFRVIDRYGDMGIVGVCLLKGAHIDTFLMSCRALGREVETTMLKIVCDARAGVALTAEYVKSQRNQMVEDFYERNGFELVGQEGPCKHYMLSEGPAPCFPISVVEVF